MSQAERTPSSQLERSSAAISSAVIKPGIRPSSFSGALAPASASPHRNIGFMPFTRSPSPVRIPNFSLASIGSGSSVERKESGANQPCVAT